ncbi:MAG: TolC family protein [Thermodesulfobacteriota bacterium]
MMRVTCKRLLAVTAPIALLFFFSGCQVADHGEAVQSIKNDTVKKKVPEQFSASAARGKVDDGWLKSFGDPVLNKLVAEALAHNPNLAAAQARVDKATGLTHQARAALKPTVGLTGGYRDNSFAGAEEIGFGSLKTSWEPDVWGRVRTGVAASEESAAASEADYHFARQSLAGATAKAWFLAITSKLQLRFAGEVVALQKKSLKIVEERNRIGQGRLQDVHLARAAMAQAGEAVTKARAAHESSLRSLELLLGRYPSADIKVTKKLVAVPPPIPAGIPSEILERRPDIIAAERRVAAAFYKQQEAELLHLPRFNFSLGLGTNSLTNAISSLSAGIFAPLYTGGAIEAQVETATAAQKETIARYAGRALEAFSEVENRLAAEEHLAKRHGFLLTVVDEDQQAYKIAKKQFDIGQLGLLDVLNIQSRWISAQIAEIDAASLQLINRVDLHLALGGSFE